MDPNSNLQEGNPGWKDERACKPHAQSATAFHFLISKRLLGLREEDEDGPAAEEPSPAGAGGGGALMSVSMADIALGLGSLRFDSIRVGTKEGAGGCLFCLRNFC